MSEFVGPVPARAVETNGRRKAMLAKSAAAVLCSLAFSSPARAKPVVREHYPIQEPVTVVGQADFADCGDPGFNAPANRQTASMRCFINNIRPYPISADPGLQESAEEKTRDVIRCGFSHFACGEPFNIHIPTDFQHYGEDLAWGVGEYGTAKQIFHAWMRSPTHRAIILGPSWDRFSVAERHSGGTAYWTAHFGEYQLGD